MSATEIFLGVCMVFLGFSLDALHRISEYLKRLVELEEKHGE